MSLADWLLPPAKGARCVLLTGLPTQFGGGSGKVAGRPGDDLFQAAMDLAAAGAETAVLSRWNVGGRVGLDLGIEFLRDRRQQENEGLASAAMSWRRAVQLVTAEQPDFLLEPRLQLTRDKVPADASHPFFWAGYTLIDCGLLPERAVRPDLTAEPAGL
jgi:hypothetical protein